MIVSIRFDNEARHVCGGTILDELHILTAAHCVGYLEPNQTFSLSVALGAHDRLDMNPAPIVRRVQRFFIHPQWKKGTAGSLNDIAILKLIRPVDIGLQFRTARTCLPKLNSSVDVSQYPPNHTELMVAGWGALELGDFFVPTILRQAQIFLVDNNDPTCNGTIKNTQSQLCAGLPKGGKGESSFLVIFTRIDTSVLLFPSSRHMSRYVPRIDHFQRMISCVLIGDSGGPIFMWAGDRWEQVGLTSYARGCAQEGAPTVFTRVAYFHDWIQSIINPSLATTTPPPAPITTEFPCPRRPSVCGCSMNNVSLSINKHEKMNKVAGGEEARPNSWSMVVSIRSAEGDHVCGGTILSDWHILTTTRCLTSIITDSTRISIHITAGVNHLSDVNAIVRGVAEAYIHPRHRDDPEALDVPAMLTLRAPLGLGSKPQLNTACLPKVSTPARHHHVSNSTLVAVGWGGITEDSDALQQIPMEMVDITDTLCPIPLSQDEYSFCASAIVKGGGRV